DINMAKKPKDTSENPHKDKPNGADAMALRWTKEIERHLDTLESMRGHYMNECRQVRKMISDCYDRAKDAGLPKKAMKAVIKTRQLEKRIESLREDLSEDGLDDDYDTIRLALGDLAELPLGAAALKDKGPNPVDSLATDDEFDAVGNANAKKIEAGIKPLPN
ncbi:MAG: hypothetical protein K2Y29_15545, partial [Beijerinckiaceae bacterium]|nr:hypothetical protein [Beijerinckiaceae bacterium]